MKRVFLAFFLIGAVFTANSAFAELMGVYVAPKLFYSLQMTDDSKLESTDNVGTVTEDVDDEDDSTFGGALAIGYDFQPNFGVPVRAEVEYALRSQSKVGNSDEYLVDDGEDSFILQGDGSMKFDIQTLFLNVYYDIDTGTPFTPYIGGGVGWAFIKARGALELTVLGTQIFDESASNTETNFAWNLAAGVGYDFNENLTFDLGYRYLDFGDVETGTMTSTLSGPPVDINYDTSLTAHEVLLAVRYTF